jgi:acetate---CoA ligase (ADP-forming)
VADLNRMLAARSIAVVGASARPDSFGERLTIEALRSGGLERVHLVNPAYDEVQGFACVPSLVDITSRLDLVVLGVPDHVVPDQLALARELGAGGAVVYGSAVGVAAAIREAAGGMPVCGAGCMGFANVSHDLRALGYLERSPLTPGGIALITHSGSMFSALLRSHRRLEYSFAVSSGQELVTTTADYLNWILDQPETRVIGLFLETIRNGPSLRAGLARAAGLDIPVVALTVGRSDTGRAMVTAHSGAIAGDDAAWEALFATYGVHRCWDVEEFVDTLELFSIGRRLTPPGAAGARGIATVHDSGAQRVLMADLAADEGLTFAEFGPVTRARLAGQLDPGLLVTNPLDVWGRGSDTEVLFTECLQAVADEPAVDVVALAVDLVEEFDGDASYPLAVLAAAAATDKPVVVISHVAASVHQPVAAELRAAGIPVLEGARSGLRAVGHLRDHAAPHPADQSPNVAESRRVAASSTGQLPRWLNAQDSLELVSAFGIDVVPTVGVVSVEGAVVVANEVGYPVVLKTDEPGIEHRALAGGVHLGLIGEEEVRTAYDALARTCGPAVAVQPQLSTTQPEVALGVLHDPAVGHIIIAAVGGSRIEELRQRVLALAPLSSAGAEIVVRRWAAVTGVVAPAGLAEALVSVSNFVDTWGDQVSALDINPLLVIGERLVAVDTLIQTRA